MSKAVMREHARPWQLLTLSACVAACVVASDGAACGSPSGTCVFPFVWKGLEWTECTNSYWMPLDDVLPWSWCATTADYDADGLWMQCTCPEPEGGCTTASTEELCRFPFEYKGKNFTSCAQFSGAGKANRSGYAGAARRNHAEALNRVLAGERERGGSKGEGRAEACCTAPANAA